MRITNPTDAQPHKSGGAYTIRTYTRTPYGGISIVAKSRRGKTTRMFFSSVELRHLMEAANNVTEPTCEPLPFAPHLH